MCLPIAAYDACESFIINELVAFTGRRRRVNTHAERKEET